jgi:hypothetical protein
MLDGFVAGATVAPSQRQPDESDLEDLFPEPAQELPPEEVTTATTATTGATTAPIGAAPIAGAPPAIETTPPASTSQRLWDFANDSRMRVWRRRIMITVIAGGIFSVIFNWRVGITIAILVAVADAVYRSRTMASMPNGVKITGAMRHTNRQLSRMRRAGYRTLHSRPIPNSPEWIDHLVIGPTGVYAIDSEKWDRRLPIRTRNARQLWHGPESKKDRLEHAKWEAEQASTLLSGNLGREIHVRPAMAVYGPKVPWDILTIRDVDVFSGNRLRKYLRKRRKAVESTLTDQDIEKYYTAAEVVLPPQAIQ